MGAGIKKKIPANLLVVALKTLRALKFSGSHFASPRRYTKILNRCQAVEYSPRGLRLIDKHLLAITDAGTLALALA